ncbi:MAG: glycosyltransferase involved in cell wall biosynthesis [Planctomycetota bacterium]|jgi:glycosyltransferase involved in cell wall biosynthesis
MKLLMVSGDRQVTIGEKGPFDSMQEIFSQHFERIDVICPRPSKTPTIFTIHDNVHFHPASCGRLGMVKYIKEKGMELIDREGHSLIVSHDYGWFYNGIGSARLSSASGVPYLSELHHVPGHPVPADLRERFDKFIAARYVAWAKSKTPAFRVVNSTEMPELLRSWGVREEQILVLPSLYIDLDTFYPSAVPGPFAQDVVYVGRMVNNKGLDRIVDALAMLKRRGAPHRALFVGKGPLAGKIRERVESAGLADSVSFVEWVDTPSDLADIYRGSRIAVCASTCEGGPRVTVEAMACGTPVVSTPVGVMTELLQDGMAGALCDFSARSLADTLQTILENESLRNKQGAQASFDVQKFERVRALEVYARGMIDLAQRIGSLS